METVIREVKPSGLGQCLEVIHKSFAPVAQRFHLTESNCPTHTSFIKLERLIFEANNGVDMYCLCDGEELIGFVGLDRRESEIVIEHLCVLPERQKQGLGTKLMEFALGKASQLGYSRVSLGIIDADEQLRRFYERAGFSVECTREFPHLPFTVCYMAREKA